MTTYVNIKIDLDELFDSLTPSEQVQFVKSHLDVLDGNDLEPYVETLGLKFIEVDE